MRLLGWSTSGRSIFPPGSCRSFAFCSGQGRGCASLFLVYCWVMNAEKTPTSKLRSALAWLDEHLLLVLSGMLIAFLPAYPKIPLADILPGYIVRFRIEDMLIIFASLVWFVQLIRGKVKLRTPLTVIIGL